MKKLFLVLAALFLAGFAFAQKDRDSVVYDTPPPVEIIDTTWAADTLFTGFDFEDFRNPPKNFEKFCVGTSTILNGSGVLMGTSNTFAPDMARSWNLHVDIAEQIKYATDSKEFGWGFALSYGYQQIGLANNLRFHTLGDKTTVWQDSTSSVTNNFRSLRLYMPFFVEYNYYLPKNKVCHLNVGTNLGLRTLRYCIKEKANDQSELRILDKTNMNYNYFIADVFLRVGIDDFSIFISKSVLPIFNSNAGVPGVYPLQIGIAFGEFD